MDDSPSAPTILRESVIKSIQDSKEFQNLLNTYYLKAELYYDNLKLICYNKKLLDNIRYEVQLSIDSLHQLCPAFKAYDLKQIYEIIIKIIEDGKCEITKKDDDLIFNMKIVDPLGKDLNESIKLNGSSNKKDEFLDVLSREIILLRKQKEDLEEIKNEQNDFKKEIEELKKLA